VDRAKGVPNPTAVDAPTAVLITYEQRGEGAPILLLHGGPGCPDYLEPVAAPLAGRRVIRFDQRGVGEATAKNGRFGIDDHLNDIEAVREHYRIERWHLFGHS
jgi:proline iminopeptidase